MADGDEKPIIKKIIKVEGGGHHGGAWKVAYADFVTAMMAFFMLLWLLNVAPPETLNGLADYFSPTTAAVAGKSGTKSINPPRDNTKGDNPTPIAVIQKVGPPPSGPSAGSNRGADNPSELAPPPVDWAEIIEARENSAFKQLEEELQVAIQESEDLTENQDQVLFEVTEDGMKIHLIDKDRRAMFRSGTAELFEYSRKLIETVAKRIGEAPNRVAVQGHTDGGAFRGPDNYSKWELSADRANKARFILQQSGVSEDRIAEVVGKSSNDPLYPDQPNRVENRRITLLLLREPPAVNPGTQIDRSDSF